MDGAAAVAYAARAIVAFGYAQDNRMTTVRAEFHEGRPGGMAKVYHPRRGGRGCRGDVHHGMGGGSYKPGAGAFGTRKRSAARQAKTKTKKPANGGFVCMTDRMRLQ
ncbi:hypothetical protein D3C87_1846050 [compost metagenome]